MTEGPRSRGALTASPGFVDLARQSLRPAFRQPSRRGLFAVVLLLLAVAAAWVAVQWPSRFARWEYAAGEQQMRRHDKGAPRAAIDDFTRAAAEYRRLKEPAGEARCYYQIALVYRRANQLPAALDFYQSALTGWKLTPDRSSQAKALIGMGMVYDLQGESLKSLDAYSEALAIEKAIGDRGGASAVLSHMGVAYFALGQPLRALELLNEGIPDADDSDEGKPFALDIAGEIYQSIDQPGQASKLHHQAALLRENQQKSST